MKRLGLALLLALVSSVWAADFLAVDDAFSVSVVGDGTELVVQFDIAEGYYLYRDRYDLIPQDGAQLSAGEFSDNVKIKYDPNFDEDMAVFYHGLEVRHQILSDMGHILLVYQGCADAGLCYPPQKRLFSLSGEPIKGVRAEPSLSLDVGTGDAVELSPPSSSAPLSSLTLISALVFALIGGLILNLMPCVFPVLSLKAMHMAQFGQNAQYTRNHGLAYTAGVVISFVAVAGLLLLIRYFGEWVGWGFQLQSPFFVAFLVFLFFAMALTMTGYIEVGQNLMGVGQGLTEKSGLTGSFFTGVLATLVATPCTAPFMGSAIGFALLQPAYVSLLIFAAMGLGLSLPILAISFVPALVKIMPKPGAWMDHFRQLMAFPLYATALWLLWVLVELQGSNALLKVGLGLILFSLAIWPALTVSSGQSLRRTWFKRLTRLLLLVTALYMIMDQRRTLDIWQDYSAALVSQSLAEGKSVFVDVTAAWCITCKANERVALSGKRFERLVSDNDIVLVRADWTNPSPAVDALIAGFNRDGVPLYAFYAQGNPVPEILPQLLTYGLIERLFSSASADQP
ncbi:protein-disulfide reductase DsbD family protein [Reinekea sp.]|jgi:thiol:disulfide interchange protein DsbD|uniref:protein-disulfide reductase DsbD family protein n=1 Tax=Reinekea sp. TaxID=1970455 RepID=UPI002A812FE7|nr:protein-disulfide reductase DsbD domain-containing protein [Reinekea sp.]